MKERADLRSRIIPTTISNTNPLTGKNGSKAFNTTDLIYLDSYYDLFINKKEFTQIKISCTDFAQMNYAYIFPLEKNSLDKQTTWTWLRTANMYESIACVLRGGENFYTPTSCRHAAICPSLHYCLPFSKDTKNYEYNPDIREVKDITGQVIYHTLQIGGYPKTKVDEGLSKTLEFLYNDGVLKEGIVCTGRWYTVNGEKRTNENFASKHVPEFEYNGNRYVRVISFPRECSDKYSDGTLSGEDGTIRWVKVEPISFIIKNWNEMPKYINPKGNEKAKYYNLRAEEGILANIPFYPYEYDINCTLWQNSGIRGFLNGINVIRIKENGNREFVANRGGDFSAGGCFLNEAFNLAREPITEYIIPKSENTIPDDAFNGCVTLKKLTIHPGVKSIGKNAFAGLNFKYAYKTETGDIVFINEISKEQEKNLIVLDIRKLKRVFDRFDYNILLNCNDLDNLNKLIEMLYKNKFEIPYVFAQNLIDSCGIEEFCNNSDFRFFKNEIPNLNELLKDCSDEEKLAFFKFATSLGCFSAKKISNNKTKFAQKASSLLAIILNTKKIDIRKLL